MAKQKIGLNPEIFREYDIRGVLDKDFTEDTFEKIGKAFGTFMQNVEGNQVAVGRDIRSSSQRLQAKLIDGLLATGCDVIDIGEIPTHLLYFSVEFLEASGGLTVTASHNPKEYNGLKLRRGYRPFDKEEIQTLYRLIVEENFTVGAGNLSERDTLTPYVECLKGKVQMARSLKVVIDGANGTNGLIASGLLRDLGCDVVELYCEPNGDFPHHPTPDPTDPHNLIDLSKKVLDVEADIGLAYDGDGDRVVAVNERGRIVWPDIYLILLAQSVFGEIDARAESDRKKEVVFEVRCSQALADAVEILGGTPVMTRCGYPNVLRTMRERKAPLAGEMSGHIYFDDPDIHFDDSIFASLKLLEFLSQSDNPMSKRLASVPEYYSIPEVRIDCPDIEKFSIVAEIVEYFRAQDCDVIDIDGARVRFEDGWALVRAANTQPALSIRCEAKTPARTQQIREVIIRKLTQYPSVDTQAVAAASIDRVGSVPPPQN
jgi:phosphomannomutase/phosphoglucomutase